MRIDFIRTYWGGETQQTQTKNYNGRRKLRPVGSVLADLSRAARLADEETVGKVRT